MTTLDIFSTTIDIQANSGHAESLILLPVPWGGKVAAFDTKPEESSPSPEVMKSFRRLAVELNAPMIMLDAIDLVAVGNPAKQTCLALDQVTDELRRDAFLDSVPDEGPPDEPGMGAVATESVQEGWRTVFLQAMG